MKRNLQNWKDSINSSIEQVRKFVENNYAEGWTVEWEVSLNDSSQIRSFVDKNGYNFKIKYIKNENGVFLPHRVISIKFLPSAQKLLDDENHANHTKQILDYLEHSYTGAKMLGDIELMCRLSRAILAFNYSNTEHLPTWEEMQNAYDGT